jgi:hypothetical protein
MALIKSEISKYKDIVSALDREVHNRGQKEITWDSFVHMDCRYSPHSVVIGSVCEELKQMGFMSTFVYDKEHLKNSMYPEDSHIAHAHGLTAADLHRLPRLLNEPVAIVTEHKDKPRSVGEDQYRCLHFIFAVKEDDEQKYYRAIVHPQSHHNGLLVNGFAAKVITYHEMDIFKFESIFNAVLNGNRQMLYFNNDRYLSIDSPTKPVEFCNYTSGSLPIKGHFTQDPNLRKIAQAHQIAVRSAVTAEMNKLIVGRSTHGEAFPLLTSSINALERGTDIAKVLSAYGTVQKIAPISTDRGLRLKTQEYADKAFARSYIRLMTPELQQEYITKAVDRIKSMSVESQSDLNGICNEIDRLSIKIPTMQNMKVNFVDSVANVKVVADARQISGQLRIAFEDEMAKVLIEKNIELQKNGATHDDQDHTIEIGNI